MIDDLRTSGAARAVHLERTYPTTPDDLWTAWTDPDRLARWLGTPTGPIVETVAPVRISMGEDANDWVDVQIVRADAPRLLELRWEFAGEPAGLLRVELTPVTGGTLLVLDHDGLTDSSTGYGAGWQAFLEGPLAVLFGAPATGDWNELFTAAMPTWRERAGALR